MYTKTDIHRHIYTNTHTHTPLLSINTDDLTHDLIAGSQMTTDKPSDSTSRERREGA
jgi:hypothetical protein